MPKKRIYKRKQETRYGISKAKYKEKQQEEKEMKRNIIPHKIPEETADFYHLPLPEQVSKC